MELSTGRIVVEEMIDIRDKHHVGGDNPSTPALGWPTVDGDYVGAFEGDRLVGSCRLLLGAHLPVILADLMIIYGLSESAACDCILSSPDNPKYAIPSLTVQALIVLPEYRRKGIATGIFQAAIVHAKSLGLSRVLVDVDSYNEPAMRLYAKCGFRSYDNARQTCDVKLHRLVKWLRPPPITAVGISKDFLEV